MRIHRRVNLTLDDLARWLNPIVRGWMTYYGRFYRSEMAPLLQPPQHLPEALGRPEVPQASEPSQASGRWWGGLIDRQPASIRPMEVDPRVLNADEKSPVKGDFHAGI